jgi:hypothetical protein
MEPSGEKGATSSRHGRATSIDVCPTLYTIDIEWLMDRMLKIMTTPDTVKSSAEEMTEVLINYSKQR